MKATFTDVLEAMGIATPGIASLLISFTLPPDGSYQVVLIAICVASFTGALLTLMSASKRNTRANREQVDEQRKQEEVSDILNENPTVSTVLSLVDDPEKAYYVSSNTVLYICLRELHQLKVTLLSGQKPLVQQAKVSKPKAPKTKTPKTKTPKKKELSLKETLKKLPTTSTLKSRAKRKGKTK
jgi:hypothetical protein